MEIGKDFYVVGIGASAGGLDAVQQLFDHLPSDTGLAYIIIQHLSPDFKSLMPELLAKHTSMEIFTAEHGQDIKPNCIYLNSRNKNIGIKNNRFILFDKAPKDHLNLPIDILFHMLGESYKEKSIGIVLSGTGSDGSRGIKTIKEAGGTIIVQEPESAQFNGMPMASIHTNLVDFVLPPDKIAEKIINFTNRRLFLDVPDEESLENEGVYNTILAEIQKQTGLNFKNYKNSTLLRRLGKRMGLHNIDNLKDYHTYLAKNPQEVNALKQEFLIGVTSFFRDKEVFEAIKNIAVPMICEDKSKQETVRIWIPGCSSGEEAYSIAILFEDYIRRNKPAIDYKIFATDVDRLALQRANNGRYPVNNIAEIDKQYLEEYFIKSGDNIQIIKKIRERIVFSYHDLTNDPPFIHMDMVSCRNMLIYLNSTTQAKILSNFQFSLKNNGILLLGTSESPGSSGRSFKVLDGKWKLYQNTGKNTEMKRWSQPEGSFQAYSYGIQQQVKTSSATSSEKKHNELAYYKYLCRKQTVVSVFVDRDYNLQFIQGDFKAWYSQKDGLFSNNLLNMVNQEMATVLRNGMRRLSEKQVPVSVKNVVFRNESNELFSTDIYFEKVNGIDSSDNLYLIQFGRGDSGDYPEQIVLSNQNLSTLSRQRIEDLEYELKETKAELNSVVEELEASNEELQSSNEELMSSNEELQSSNEELQSANEELYTINTELQEKNRELENLNNDINNLLNSTDIGTLFLDTSLNIRKFTPAIKRIFKLEETDIGRSIISFASEFDDETRRSIINDTKASLESLLTFEKEITDSQGHWYLKRITPFVTSEKKIDGVVINFIDITNLKQTRHDLSAAELRLTSALEAGKMAWWEIELPSGKVSFSKNKTRLVGHDEETFSHFHDFMKIIHPDDHERINNAFRIHEEGKKEFYEYEYRMKNSEGKYQWFHDLGKTVYKDAEKTIVSGISIEITDKKRNELNLLKAMKKAETANIYKNQFLANISHEIRTPMNGLVSFASLLRNDNLNSQTRNRYVDIIESSSKQLLNLINDIIDVSKIEAGELSINIGSCNLKNLFLELGETFNKLKKEKKKENIEIVISFPHADNELVIKTDPVRLRQVLTNLIGNALKFTDEGRIEAGYEVKHRQLEFFVKDTGIGISQEKLNIIFERFQRLEPKNGADYEGTGLGLSISKGIIDLLGGTINVESEEGRGTTFSFTLPFELAGSTESTPALASDIENLAGKSILIAEDDLFIKLYLEEILKEMPVNTIWANDGKEVIDLFKRHKDVALILMDLRMPKLSGIQAAQEILKLNPDTKIIAQTAHAMANDREVCIRNGFVDYITKPLEKDKLFELIIKWSQ